MAFITDKFNGKDYFENIDFHHIEFYVGNAKQATEFYKKLFGFEDFAYSGPESGSKEKVSYVIKKNKVFFVLTTPLISSHFGTKWLSKHGDGVYNIAFKVNSVKDSFNGCVDRGAEIFENYSGII